MQRGDLGIYFWGLEYSCACRRREKRVTPAVFPFGMLVVNNGGGSSLYSLLAGRPSQMEQS